MFTAAVGSEAPGRGDLALQGLLEDDDGGRLELADGRCRHREVYSGAFEEAVRAELRGTPLARKSL